MTIIAAAIDATGGYIASDSACSFGDQIVDIGSKLIVVQRDLVVGFTGQHVIDSLFSAGELDSTLDALKGGADRWNVGRWWWAVYDYHRSHGTLNPSHDMPSWGLAVTPDQVISINADGSSFVIVDGYFAVGSGREIGQGVLWATRRRKAVTRVEMAVQACLRHCNGCGGSVHLARAVRYGGAHA